MVVRMTNFHSQDHARFHPQQRTQDRLQAIGKLSSDRRVSAQFSARDELSAMERTSRMYSRSKAAGPHIDRVTGLPTRAGEVHEVINY
jgi:hypothetical protein